MRHLILSVDYEIFGNGSGDVRRHAVDPAAEMARVCERFQAPLTVFFEAEEYVAFDQHAEALKKGLGYDPAALIRQQIISLVRRGHNVQLHLHPQWHGARYEGGRWRLNPQQMTVDSLFESQSEVTDYVAGRKRLIEEMVAAGNSSRKVRAYRAGAFCAQPGRKLLAALAECEIVIDSSVVKGLHSVREGFDYRGAPSAKGPWPVRDDVAAEASAGLIWEFPIYAVMGRRFQQLTPTRLRAKFSANVPKERQRETMEEFGVRPSHPFGLIKLLWQKVPIKLDYHNLAPGKIVDWIRSAPTPAPGRPDVVMLIGHTKEHLDNKGLERLLEMIQQEGDMKVISLDEAASLIQGTRASPVSNCS